MNRLIQVAKKHLTGKVEAVKKEVLFSALTEELSIVTAEVLEMTNEETDVLLMRTAPSSWNVLECYQHLVLYGEYYFPEIQEVYREAEVDSGAGHYVPTFLGDLSTVFMKPDSGKFIKMKAFQEKNPIRSLPNENVLETFMKQQQELEKLIERATAFDINRMYVSISVARAVKLNIGDMFRFLTYHIVRHHWQAKNVLNAIKEKLGEEVRS